MLGDLVRFHGVTVGFSGILFQPFLELHFEVEALAQVLLKEGSQFLGADDALRDGFINSWERGSRIRRDVTICS
jgi:hypothetical protein